MDKTEIIKLLEAMRDSADYCYDRFKKERKHAAKNHYFGEYLAFDEVIRILTKPEFAEKMKNIYLGSEKEAI